MKKSVLITAVSGSGKSTLCKALQKLGYVAHDIEDIPGLFSLVDKDTGKHMPKHDHGNVELVKQGDWNCDVKKMQVIINNETDQLAFYCGAASNIEDIRGLFDLVIILKVSDDTSLKRLRTRKVGSFGHTDEVRDWVLSWKHEIEDEWIEAGGIPVNAEDTPELVAKKVLSVVNKNGSTPTA